MGGRTRREFFWLLGGTLVTTMALKAENTDLFTFSYAGKDAWLRVPISRKTSLWFSERPFRDGDVRKPPDAFVSDPYDRPALRRAWNGLDAILKDRGFSGPEHEEGIVRAFVSSLAGRKENERINYPTETLFNHAGTATDKAILVASLLDAHGYETALCRCDGDPFAAASRSGQGAMKPLNMPCYPFSHPETAKPIPHKPRPFLFYQDEVVGTGSYTVMRDQAPVSVLYVNLGNRPAPSAAVRFMLIEETRGMIAWTSLYDLPELPVDGRFRFELSLPRMTGRLRGEQVWENVQKA